MKRNTTKSRFTVTINYSPVPMTQAEWEASEDLLAKMVARAIAAEQGWLKTNEDRTEGDDQNAPELDSGRQDRLPHQE